MRILLAYLFKLLFFIKPLRRHYFGLYKKFFRPLNLFRNVRLIAKYDGVFRMRLNLDEWIQQQIFFFGIYDQPGISFIKKRLAHDDVFIDIGANIGIYSLSASRSIRADKGGKIFAFEPVNHVFDRLKENIGRNDLTDLITPYRLAIYDSKTSLNIFVSDPENLGMSSLFHHDHESGTVEQVDTTTMDDFIRENKLPGVSLIKMDIEGAELYALKGMYETLKRFRPTLLVEISEQVLKGQNVTGQEVFELLNNAGYESFILDDKGDTSPKKNDPGYSGNNYVFIHPESRQ